MEPTKEQFIATVVAKVLYHMPSDATDRDRESVGWSAEVAWNTGCDIADAIYYCRTFEEVSPDLTEEIAFGRRDLLRAKYKGKARIQTNSPGNDLI